MSSIWNRIGDVASTIGHNAVSFGKDIAGSATGIARIAWDIGTAPWNDAKEYNGFVKPFKTAINKEGGNVIKPLASAGGAIMKVPGVQPLFERINQVNRDYIREPLTTVALVNADIQKGDVSPAEIFNPNTWKAAYTNAQEISLGQAVLNDIRVTYDPKFNIYDPAQREAAFKKSAWGKALSGGTDLAAQLFLDVTLAGGKVAKAVKASELGVGTLTNAETIAKAAEDITKAQYGETNRFTKVLEDFTKNDSTYALNHPMVKSSNEPGLLAHLLGDSVDKDETALILRSALGDPAAMDELAQQRAYITDALKTARGDLSAADEYKLFAAPDDSGMLPFLNENPAVIEAARANYESLAKTDKYFADLMQVGGAKLGEEGLQLGTGSLTRTTGTLGQNFENFIAQARSVKYYDQKVGNPNVEVFQPTPFHRLYQKISWAAGERPAGIVDFNDPDSYKEIVANVNQLEKIVGLTPDTSKKILDSYISASTPEARFTATMNLENRAVRAIAKKYNIDEEVANKIYNNFTGARTSALKSIQDKGYMVDLDDSIIKVPQFESQTANYLPLMDFALLDDVLKHNSTVLSSLAGKAKYTTLNLLDVTQDLFKAGALLRLGYTQRNAIDSQLRIAASVGAFASLRHLGPGLRNVIDNVVSVPARMVDRYRPVDDTLTYAKVQKKSQEVVKELNQNKAKIASLEAKLSLKPDDLNLSGQLNTAKLLQEEKQAVYDHYVDVLNRSKGVDPKKRIGTGSYEVTTSDGKTYILDDAFGGPLGDMFRRIASSGNSFDRMVDSNADMYARKLSYKGIGRVTPEDPGYFDQWAQTLRQVFGNSAVVNKIVAGQSMDDIARWLRNSPEGRDLRRRLAIDSADSSEYVTKVAGFLDKYLPASSGLREKIKDVTAADLRSAFQDPTTLPVIHGHILEENILNVSKIKGREIINSLFHLLGTLPEDTWARNPLYVYLYRKEASRRLNILSDLKGGAEKVPVTSAEQAKVMADAHKYAQREMKNILFNIERKSNLAAAMKFISPFFSAQENAYKTWMKLAVANPAIANRGYMVWNAPNRMGLVTDAEGNPVPEGKTTGNDVIWVGLPKGLQRIPGMQSLTELGIPKGSLDIIFQGGMDALFMEGNPNIVSDVFPVGPYVAIPISEVVKNQPSLEDVFKWALPFGPSKSVIDGFLPTWVKKQQVAAAGLENPQFARSYQLIWETEQMKAKRNGDAPVSPAKILQMTKDYWNMRTVAALVAPFAPQFNSPYMYYINKSREYRRQFGVNADAKFLEDYPDFFEFTASLSKNPTGVQSSVQAVNNIKKYSELTSELVGIEPKLVGLVVNDFAGYDFSQAAYDYLYQKQISPASADKYLSSQSPADAQKKVEANKGWTIYNKFMDAIDNVLQDRGLVSVQQKGAEDLAALKKGLIAKLAVKTDAQGNPILNKATGQYQQSAWYDDYLDSDGSKTNRVINGLDKIISNKKFMEANSDSPTWKSVNAYLDLRKNIATVLATRTAKSIDAKSNVDLKYIYDGVVNKLKQDDKLGFAYIYDRFLSQDLAYDKYLTPAPVEGTK